MRMMVRGSRVLSVVCFLSLASFVGCNGCSSGTSSNASTGGSMGTSGTGGSGNNGGSSSSGSTTMSVMTYHNDNARTGQNTQETTLTTANVASATFGKVGFYGVDGKVDAEPLYVPAETINGATHNVLYVETEHDSAYAFDADNGTVLWHVSAAGPNETSTDDRKCSQVTPEIGVTNTPVVDPKAGAHGTIFFVAASKDSSGNYHQRLHALDLTTGAEQSGSPTNIQATYPSSGPQSHNGQIVFDPAQYNDRAGLLLVNGVIYIAWGSHCDINPYT
ncbi:MAG: pyrrolo-quinoline quinone, partial [Pseudomonadota bacterium]|nr:pyrrolo-quinoline quinone [Pseudomonadota bacterium]